MKRSASIFSILIFSLLFVSCMTITYMSPDKSDVSFPSDGKYEILGRTTIENSQTSAGYLLLLEAAKKQFPGTDDVVNIIIDKKSTTTIKYFIFREVSYTYMLSGIAIKFKK